MHLNINLFPPKPTFLTSHYTLCCCHFVMHRPEDCDLFPTVELNTQRVREEPGTVWNPSVYLCLPMQIHTGIKIFYLHDWIYCHSRCEIFFTQVDTRNCSELLQLFTRAWLILNFSMLSQTYIHIQSFILKAASWESGHSVRLHTHYTTIFVTTADKGKMSS